MMKGITAQERRKGKGVTDERKGEEI